jgi:hypothetical protein
MSKKSVAASRRDDRLAFFPVGFPYERRLLTQDEVTEYARERGKEAAREAHRANLKKKAKTRK